MTKKRPDPDKLLHRAQEEERKEKRGQLKIYLGAAPGVGKTYEMLQDALTEKSKELDIVIGIAESHGRQEIEALLGNFEILPRQEIAYHGTKLYEFSLDGALKRHPGLILIDEMAHTNAPGQRHKKRWQDIKELLDRGINVCTTLNVQHIESLNDKVTQIINAPIKETVPDSMLELADTIELVDIPPEELLKRLHEGKIYFPEQATLAAESFFRKGNLIALRELALRTVAHQVGSQVLTYREGQGIKHIWPTRDKILVCVGAGEESLKIIRAAKRMASSLQADWLAVYIDTPKIKASEEKLKRAIQNLRFAEQLGAETRVITGFDIVNEIMTFAREQNVTQIMIWKHIRNRWQNLFFRSLADEILRYSGEIDVYIMTGSIEPGTGKNLTESGLYINYITPIALVIISSVLVLVFFPGNFFTTIVFSILILTVIQLTFLTRRQAKSARLIQHQTSALYMLSRQLASTRGIDNLLATGINYVGRIFNSAILALLPQEQNLTVRARYGTNQDLDEKEMGIAEWVYELGQRAGLGTDSLAFSNALYLPLLGSQEVLGVLRIHPAQPENLNSPELIHLLEACVNQIALALEVDRLQEQAKTSELKTETDRVRSALLKSVSHDLRTPLISIIGSASNQIETAAILSPRSIANIGKSIYFEAMQLNRLINNLLQITYLEAENVHLQKEALPIKDIITSAIQNINKILGGKTIDIKIPANLPLIPMDKTLMEEVFLNLIDNAIKFTPIKTPIEISALHDKNQVIISVLDHGPGIVHDEVNKLFEKFYRGRMLTEKRGLGLGLAICRSIIAAHGGEIWAENVPEGGAVFRFTLPL